MKRIVLSLASIALLSAVVVPMAQAAPFNVRGGLHPEILNPAQTPTPDVEPSAQAHPISALEQAHLNRLDRVANTPSSLNRQQAAPTNDLDPYNLASVSPLQQARLAHLNNNSN
ncbi:MAG: hypothetical protein WA783_00740 [Phormidesmis sp.]